MARSGESARSLEEELLEVARAFGERGVAMGELVDRVVARGSAVEAIEAAIWGLLGARLLTPSGFVCRLLRQPGGGGSSPLRRSYELRLAVWSPELDGEADPATDATDSTDLTWEPR